MWRLLRLPLPLVKTELLAKNVIVSKHLNPLERQEGCVDNSTLYPHRKLYAFQSHLNIDYLILRQSSFYYLHLTDGGGGGRENVSLTQGRRVDR